MKSKRAFAGAAVLLLTAGLRAGAAGPEPLPEGDRAALGTEALLSQSRVKVSVTWRSPYDGQSGTALAVPQGDEFASFTFSTPENPEVVVKALGSADPDWIKLFAAGLTTFEYTVTFAGCGQTRTFTQKGNERTRFDDPHGLPLAGCEPWSNETTVMLPGGVPLTMVRIPAGTYAMGSAVTERGRESDETLHAVTLARGWYLGKTEVTEAQWQAVMGAPVGADCGRYHVAASDPVSCVSWNDVRGAGGFLEKLNAYLAETGQPGAGKLRLPTEAEWERAARGGTATRFSFGDAAAGSDGCGANADADPYAWWCGNETPAGLQTAGAKKANPYGLFDIHGNAWELVEDWYGDYAAGPVTDPAGPKTGTYRVVRGGGWGGDLSYCRSAQRNGVLPSDAGDALGFRLARSN